MGDLKVAKTPLIDPSILPLRSAPYSSLKERPTGRSSPNLSAMEAELGDVAVVAAVLFATTTAGSTNWKVSLCQEGSPAVVIGAPIKGIMYFYDPPKSA